MNWVNKSSIQKIVVVILLVGIAFPITIYARTSSEIADEIKKQQDALNNTQRNLDQAKQDLANFNNSAPEGSLAQIENEIKKLEAEISANKYELELNQKNKELKELEKAQTEIEQGSTLKTIYMDWRIENSADVKEVLHSYDFKKYETYASVLTNTQQGNIYGLADELNGINTDIVDYEKKLAELDTKSQELQQRKTALEDQIRYYNSRVYSLGNQVSNLQGTLSTLTVEQKAAIQRESDLQNQNPVSPGSGSSGNLYFTMRGRDARQGHGVGMSQYGAKGAAEHGWNADQILTFYYTGTQVTSTGISSEISVKYCPNNPALDPFQDGCNGGEAAVVERVSFDLYLSGLGEMPESWPIEARKAQMIAARTYAVSYTGNGNPNNPICLTTYCQVSYFKNGDTRELDIAQATSGKVVTHGGNLISALYSSDNSQGFGTADNDTIWQNFQGYGTPSPYLRAVNDTAFANTTYYTNKECRTNDYSLADIYDVIAFNKDTFYQTGYRPAITNIYNQLGGSVTNISFVRDSSQRVKRVVFNNNSNITIGGSWFKALWNEWVYFKNKVNTSSCQDLGSPRYDYIYSQTLFLHAN